MTTGSNTGFSKNTLIQSGQVSIDTRYVMLHYALHWYWNTGMMLTVMIASHVLMPLQRTKKD
jgi:hypothetical protein